MKKIKVFSISGLHNEELFAYAQTTDNVFGRVNNNNLMSVYNRFHTAYLDFQHKLEPVNDSTYTKTLLLKDHNRDAHYSMLRSIVKSFRSSSNPTEAAAANQLFEVFKKYDGSTRMNLKKESGRLFNFVEELQTTYHAQVETLHLTELVMRMNTLNEEFNTAYLSRDEAKRIYFSSLEVKASRQTLIEAYLDLIAAFEGLCIAGMFSGDENAIVTPMNEAIAHWKTVLRKRDTYNAKKQEEKEADATNNGENSNEGGSENNGEENGGDNGGENTNTDNTDPNQGEDNTPSANA